MTDCFGKRFIACSFDVLSPMVSAIDLSTGDENRISVKFDGWPDKMKDRLIDQLNRLHGVTRVASAGGKTSAYVYFNPRLTTIAGLEASVGQVAANQQSDSGTGPYATEISHGIGPGEHALDDQIDETLGIPISSKNQIGEIGTIKPQSLSSNQVLSEPDVKFSQQKLKSVVRSATSAKTIKSSSSWTGRKSISEQVKTIRRLAPLTLKATTELEDAIREKRFNDPDTIEALLALREIHEALSEFLAEAEGGKSFASLWDKFEDSKERFYSAVKAGAKVFIVAPATAVGATTMLSFFSGFPVTEAMLLAVYGSGVLGEHLKKR